MKAPAVLAVRWRVILFPLLFLAAFFLSGTAIPNSSNIDASMWASIEYAACHRWQFGTDILFTYGPLGFLSSNFSQGLFPLSRILSAVAIAAMTAWLTLSVASSLNSNARPVFLLWAIFFATYVDIEQNVFFLMACCFVKIIHARKGVMTLLVIPVFLAFLSLIKFAFLLVAMIAAAICVVYLFMKGRTAYAITVSASFMAAFAALWSSLGQKFANLLPWLRGSLEITSGYVDAVYSAPETVPLACSLCALAIFISMLVSAARKKISKPVDWVPLLLLLAFAFISWKMGFVRADEQHTARFFISFPLIAALILADADTERAPVANRSGLLLALIAIMVVCLSVFQLQAKGMNFPAKSLLNFIATIETNSGQLVKIATGRYAECFKALPPKGATGDPAISALVGTESIDVINWNSWLALGNRLNYRPRPVFQSYATFTPYLQNLNLSFMKSAGRPDWILARMDSVDDKLPVMEDALLYPWIIRNYQPEWSDDSTVLFKIKPLAATPPTSEIVMEKWITFGQEIDFSNYHDFPFTLQVEVEQTFWGRLAGLLYKRPPLLMSFAVDGKKTSKRFVPSMAREGILLHPFLRTVKDVRSYYQGEMPRVDSLSLTVPSYGGLFYNDKIKIRISRLGL